MDATVPWERAMYKRQNYPPNYISDEFLKGLHDNVNNSYSLRDLCPKTLLLTQHISTMLIMAHVYIMIKDDAMPLEYVECGTILSILLLSLLMYLNKAARIDHYRNVRLCFVVYVTLKLSQPVLQTLTSSFSCDTVYALAILLSILNILTYDYDLRGHDDGYVNYAHVLPMNCLVLVSILMASRFGCPKKASAYLQLYMVYDTKLKHLTYLMDCGSSFPLYSFTLTVMLITCRCLYQLHIALLPAYLLGNISINIIVPLTYIYAQGYKRVTTVDFPSKKFCALAYQVLESEENTHNSTSTVTYEQLDKVLKVVINAADSRTLRLKVNAFYETCYLISSIIEKFSTYVDTKIDVKKG